MSSPKQGSTLILALLIVSVVSSMAFAAGQLFVSEARIAGTLEDTSTAYYAAESGIDKGISEFKTDRNKQICQGGGNCTSASSAQPQTPFSNGANHDIKMWYLGCAVGDVNGDCLIKDGDLITDPANNNYSKSKRLKKDESVLLDISKAACIGGIYPNCPGGSGDIDIYYKFKNVSIGDTDPDTAPTLEIKAFTGPHTNQSGIIIVTRAIFPGGSYTAPSFNCSNNCLFFPRLLDKIAQQTPTIGSVNKNQITTLEIKMFGDDLIYGIQPTVANTLIDLGVTTIETTGTFGRVKRKLQAKIDRTSGTVIGLFDFTLFSQQGIN